MTDKEAKAFYNSSAWKHKRMQILDRDHYECQDCRKRIKDAAASGTQLIGRDRKIWRAEEVHHIQELKEHPELGLDDDNLVKDGKRTGCLVLNEIHAYENYDQINVFESSFGKVKHVEFTFS